MKISDLTELFDIPRSTLRYLEEKKILNPQRMTKRGNRNYTAEDLYDLLAVKYYHTLGFTFEESKTLLQEDSLQELITASDKRLLANEQNLLYQSLLNRKMKRWSIELKRAGMNAGNWWFDSIAAFSYIKLSIHDSNLKREPVISNTLVYEWMKYSSLCNIAYRVQYPVDDADDSSWIMMFDKEVIEKLGMMTDESVENMPDCFALVTYAKADEHQSVLPILKEAEYHLDGHQPVDVILAKLIARTHEGNRHVRYYEIILPLKS